RVLVETTGLADPVPLLETLCEDAHVTARYRPQGVVTMVDGINAGEQFEEFAEPVKQVAIADRLLVSKADLATPVQLDRLQARLRTLNPGAPIVRVVTSGTDAATALGPAWRPEAEGAFDWIARSEQVTRASGQAPVGHLAQSA